jgi:hypothetical protein
MFQIRKPSSMHLRKYSIFLALIAAISISACTPSKKLGRVTGDMTKEGSKQNLSSPAGDFTLRPPNEMRRMGQDSVPWSSAIPQSKDNGVVVYFFGQGASIALASPHLRIEYISTSMSGAGNSEELFEWLKGMFVGDNYQGEVVSEGKTITTADGKAVPWLEIAIPETKDPTREELTRSAKSMLWAYIPLGDNYLIGINATAVFPEDYRELKKAFFTTVGSFRE